MYEDRIRPNIAALKQVVRALKAEDWEQNAFHIGNWHVVPVSSDDRAKCGTVGCAIGFAASTSWFKNRGLHLVTERTISQYLDPREEDGYRKVEAVSYMPAYAGKRGFDAIEAFFQISGSDAYSLFHPEGYNDIDEGASLQNVIAKIEEFISEHE
jgi:hypothetical protein